jgi:hypothetical protein
MAPEKQGVRKAMPKPAKGIAIAMAIPVAALDSSTRFALDRRFGFIR